MTRAIREADSTTLIMLSKPWNWDAELSLAYQARPFATLLGCPEPVAVRETGSDTWGGDPSLLQIVGLNFYNNWGVAQGWPVARLLLEARRHFPDQQIIFNATSNAHFADRHTIAGWLQLIDEQVELYDAQGADVQAVTWAPILTLGDFDWGHPAPGAWVTWEPDDAQRRRHRDAEVVRIVRAYVE